MSEASAPRRVVIVGAGHAGGRAAEALRREGFEGAIALIGEEPARPYERPPLSKGLLTGTAKPDSWYLRDVAYYAENDIELILGDAAHRLDLEGRTVTLASGRQVPYDRLLLATGGRVRELEVPGARLAGVQTLRTLADAQTLEAALGDAPPVVVAGAGFIGLEVAASARERGCEVTVLEIAGRIMARAVPEAMAERVAALHAGRGVHIRCGERIEAFEDGGGGQLGAVLTGTGERLTARLGVVGIGIDPRIELAADAGLALDNGIAVDARLRTSAEDVYAIGDAVSFPHPLFDTRIRLEAWRNAEEQARAVAVNLLGGEQAFAAVPWFWSDQYDHALQIAGLPALGESEVRRADPSGALFAFQLTGEGRIVGAAGFGPRTAIGRDIRAAQMLIEQRARPDPRQLADPDVKMRSLLA